MPDHTWLEYIEATSVYQWLRLRMNLGLVSLLTRHVLSGQKHLRIAEMACGSGYASHLLAQRPEVALSIAADINLEDYQQASISDFGASFLLTDLFHPGLFSNSLDLVWNSSSIEEIDQPELAVRSMASLVKPGGLLFIGVPNHKGVAGLLRLITSESTKKWLGRVYSHSELRALLEDADLEVEIEVTYFFAIFIGAVARKKR